MSEYTNTLENGNTVTGTLVDGKVHGAVTTTFPGGQPHMEKHFDMSVPTGTHTRWDQDGNITNTIVYENGVPAIVDGVAVDATTGAPLGP